MKVGICTGWVKCINLLNGYCLLFQINCCIVVLPEEETQSNERVDFCWRAAELSSGKQFCVPGMHLLFQDENHFGIAGSP